jgi:hypothetical protein
MSAAVSAAVGAGVDYAEARHAEAWLRHPVYGDPSFDSFERLPGNPIHRGAPPFEWPVNGFFFDDPVSGNWFVYVGDYGKGYLHPPSRCVLYRSNNRGASWTNLGVVLHGDPDSFDCGGHTPDVSVVYANRRYHMVYDWGETNFNAEGGLAYAWAERPEGPWHRAAEPITRNTSLSKLLGRYQRTYAATLLRRQHDWLILAMMDCAPRGWALFAITARTPDSPWSERRLVRHVEADYYHPPLLEFFPAFAHRGQVYAPATSVALNRNFNVLFRADLERADDPAAWRLFQHGSVWHAEDVEHEFHGIWGQTFSGAVDRKGTLRVMFPSRDAQGRGTINLAQHPWHKPLRPRGFVLTGHQGPSLTLLRQAYDDFQLEAELQLRGRTEILLDYAAPLNPSAPSSDATLHPLTRTRHVALALASGSWRLVQRDAAGKEAELASARLSPGSRLVVQLARRSDLLSVAVNHRSWWTGPVPPDRTFERTGVLGLRVETNTHLFVEKFRIHGQAKPAAIRFGAHEALLGAAEAPADWEAQRDDLFRFGAGVVSRKPAARVKWNVPGHRLALWSPRGPEFGEVEVRLDGQVVAVLNLEARNPEASRAVWQSAPLADGGHALVLRARVGRLPVDAVEALCGSGREAKSLFR